MLEYRYDERFIRILTNNPDSKLEVNSGNANWHLYHFGRDLSLTKGIYEQKLNFNRIEASLPPSLQVANKNFPIAETRAFISLLHSMIKYVEQQENPYRVEKEKIRTTLENIEQQIKESRIESAKEDHEKIKKSLLSKLTDADFHMTSFVENIISTGIQVDKNTVTIYSREEGLLRHLKEDPLLKEYDVRVVKTSEGQKYDF